MCSRVMRDKVGRRENLGRNGSAGTRAVCYKDESNAFHYECE